MLTRLEIDGFKTFRSFALDLPPFLVVLGRNASGKSNLFDVIQFLKATADGNLMEAVQRSRGELDEILHRDIGGDRHARLDFALEVLLDSRVTDDFGDSVAVGHSRLRYELSLELRPVASSLGSAVPQEEKRERLFVSSEKVSLIRLAEDTWVSRYAPNSAQRRNLAKYSSRSSEILLETVGGADGRPVFSIRQEGHAGRPRLLPASEATTTVLSSLNSASDNPLLYALKKEMLSWGLLHLDPVALRKVNNYDDDDVLTSQGSNLANALRRISLETADQDRPYGVLADVSADLARIIPEVTGLAVDEDRERRQRQVVVHTRDDAPYTARVASDGTLRSLALLVALYDPQVRGLLCFEEPENGIYPQRLVQFVGHLRRLVNDNFQQRFTDADRPTNQLLLSSHSPVILHALADSDGRPDAVREDVAFFDTVSRRTNGRKSRVSRVRQVRPPRQESLPLPPELRGLVVSPAEIEDFEVAEMLTT